MFDSMKIQAAGWFSRLRDEICTLFEVLEQEENTPLAIQQPYGAFDYKDWQREGGGGGTMAMMRGRVFEKVGVNVSTVWGEFSPAFRAKIPGTTNSPRFWASGISLVAHPQSPLVPAVHFNTRLIVTETHWWGGGGDLTPMFINDDDTSLFHAAFRDACDQYNSAYYPLYKQACDEYFYLAHRNEPRGVGGIFVDNHNSGDLEKDFAFIQDLGRAFVDVYPKLVRRHYQQPWTQEQRTQQLQKRGRYVEFNLLYDRGTLFGLQTGGNTEAILMSLPPTVTW